VKIADSLAYLNHDIEDAIRAELLAESDLPRVVHEVLGRGHSARVETLITDVVGASAVTLDDEPRIRLSPDTLEATDALREFMFTRVYLHEATLVEAHRGQQIVEALYRYYEAHPEEIAGFSLPDDPAWRRAADYVAGMTDGYATSRAQALGLIPSP
jgi:dGTPase